MENTAILKSWTTSTILWSVNTDRNHSIPLQDYQHTSYIWHFRYLSHVYFMLTIDSTISCHFQFPCFVIFQEIHPTACLISHSLFSLLSAPHTP